MSHDDTGGFSLTNPEESASSGEAGGDGRIAADGRTMTGNDLGGRSLVQALVQAQVQAGVQGVAGMRLPIGGLSKRVILIEVMGGQIIHGLLAATTERFRNNGVTAEFGEAE